jgi:hypothetical protein
MMSLRRGPRLCRVLTDALLPGVEVGRAVYNNPSIGHFPSSCSKTGHRVLEERPKEATESARKLSLNFAAGAGKALRPITDSCRHTGRCPCGAIDSAVCRNPHRDAHRSLNAMKPLLTTSMPGNGGIFLPRCPESGFGPRVPFNLAFASGSLGTTGPAPGEKGILQKIPSADIGDEAARPGT